MHVYPEDAGTYTLKATNVLGQAVNSADLNVRSKETIVKDTLHSAAMKQITHLEQQQVSQVSNTTYYIKSNSACFFLYVPKYIIFS